MYGTPGHPLEIEEYVISPLSGALEALSELYYSKYHLYMLIIFSTVSIWHSEALFQTGYRYYGTPESWAGTWKVRVRLECLFDLVKYFTVKRGVSKGLFQGKLTHL